VLRFVTDVRAKRSFADSGHVQIRVAIVDDHELCPAGSCIPFRGTLRRTGVWMDGSRIVALIGLNGPITVFIRSDVDAGTLVEFDHARHSRADRRRPHRHETLCGLRSCQRIHQDPHPVTVKSLRFPAA
jgi:hypothetical protein